MWSDISFSNKGVLLIFLKICLKVKSMVDVIVFISVRFYVCMYIFMNINCRWFYEMLKKNVRECRIES